jgi:hypothetical protein
LQAVWLIELRAQLGNDIGASMIFYILCLPVESTRHWLQRVWAGVVGPGHYTVSRFPMRYSGIGLIQENLCMLVYPISTIIIPVLFPLTMGTMVAVVAIIAIGIFTLKRTTRKHFSTFPSWFQSIFTSRLHLLQDTRQAKGLLSISINLFSSNQFIYQSID